MRKSLKLVLGAGIVALLFGGLAPLAHADRQGDVDICTSELGGAESDSEGALWELVTAGADGEEFECGYATTGGTHEYTIATLNEWRVEVRDEAGAVVTSKGGKAVAEGGSPVTRDTIDASGGASVVVVLVSACQNDQCGASGTAGIGRL